MNRWKVSVIAIVAGLLLSSLIASAPWARAGVVDLYLYGADPDGWGRYPGNLTRPGPYLTYTNGTQVRLTLHSVDSSNHAWFVDYNNNSVRNPGEPTSGTFSNPGGTTFNPITLNRTGNFTYRCRFHPSTMWGKINIVPGAVGPGGSFAGITLDWNLIIFAVIMLVVTISAVVAFKKIWRSRSSGEDEEIAPPRARSR